MVCKKYTNDHSSVTELIWRLHWLPIKARVQYKILLLLFKALNTGTPSYFLFFCRVTWTSQKINIMKLPAHGKGRHSMEAFSIGGPTRRNELLTDELRECTSVDMFKKRMKTHHFHLHYEQLFIFRAQFPEFLLCYCRHIYFHCYCIYVNTLD